MSKKQVIELEWFSVDEKLPKFRTKCLVRLKSNYVLTSIYDFDEGWYQVDVDLQSEVIEWCYYPLFSYVNEDV